MLVTPGINRRNQLVAISASAIVALSVIGAGLFYPWCWLALLLVPVVYWWLRRRCLRRMRVMKGPLPQVWEGTLRTRVAYYNALDEQQQQRFGQLVKIFLDETRITGIRTDVDETTRVLVAASAIIPVFRFPNWEYTRLGEVLIYPGSFNNEFETDGDGQRNTLGMVGDGYLGGVMILSKPSLHSGFDIGGDKRNVGIHEFAHLVDKGDGIIDGIPPGIPADVMRQWIEWVGSELADPPDKRTHINPYAYTNEAEYFAVLVEYFFEAPGVLQSKNPQLYDMLEKMFRQDTASFLSGVSTFRARRIGRNSRCPCGSGKKYKKCCLRMARQGLPR